MSKIRWAILLILIVSLIGCATYTSNMGYEKIVLESEVSYKETRYKAILEEKEKIAEAERLEQERLEKERLKNEERIKEEERIKAEAERLEQERLEKERLENEERIKEEERLKAEEERLEQERLEKERLENEERIKEEERLKAEEERLEQERLEKERLAEEERIKEEERLKAEEERLEQERLEKERLAEEERKARENALAQSLAKARRINSYPSELSSMSIPHIYRPQDNPVEKDDNFTRLDVLFIPLGSTKNDINQIISSISHLNVDFIFITGPIADRVSISKMLAKDTVTLNGGSIIFNSELLQASSDTASFKISENKDIEIAMASLSDKAAVNSKDSESWREYLSLENEKDKEKVLSVVEQIKDSQAIFALSSSQPSSLDWSIFTPYSYRTDANFDISDELNKTMSDTFRSTHFSEETDGGITIITPYLSERLDFLYTKGLIEVSSTTLALSGLSNMDIERFAILATYIIP